MFKLSSLKIGFIGAGNMTSHLVKGLIEICQINPQNIYVTNRSSHKAQSLANYYGVHHSINAEEIFDHCDWIFFSIKPKDFAELSDEVTTLLSPNHHVISLMAGISLDQLRRRLHHQNISRIIPNIGVSVGNGVIGIYSDQALLQENLAQLFRQLGEILILKEETLLDALLVGTSAGIGLVLELMTYFADWLESYGFSQTEARKMMEHTFLGAGKITQFNSEIAIEDIIGQVASKKGVTEKSLETLRAFELDRIIRIALDAGKQRCEDLARLA